MRAEENICEKIFWSNEKIFRSISSFSQFLVLLIINRTRENNYTKYKLPPGLIYYIYINYKYILNYHLRREQITESQVE